MNAIFLVRHGPSDKAFEFRELPDPVPGPGEVCIAVEASGVNFADLLARKGLYRDTPPFPCILGYDIAGWVDSVGRDVDTLRPGTRVVAMTRFGGYASKVVVQSQNVMPLPDNLDFAAATALGTQYTTAWLAAMEMVRLHPRDHIVVHAAAGGVGTALVQLAKRCGCIVFGTTGSPEKLDYLSSIGVDYPICTTQADSSAEILRHSNGHGPDVIFDSLGGASVRAGLRLLSPGGRIVCLGASTMCGPPPHIFRVIRTMASFGVLHAISLLINSNGIIGVNLLRIADQRPDIVRRCLQSVVDLAARKELHPVVGGVFSYRDVVAAHAILESRGSVGKVVLRWHDEKTATERKWQTTNHLQEVTFRATAGNGGYLQSSSGL